MTTPRINAREWLSERDDYYRAALMKASLVVEADYTQDDVVSILRAFGAGRRFYERRGDPPQDAFQDYPHCLLVGMVGTAAVAPEINTFWPEFWRLTGTDPAPELQGHVGDAFLRALSRRRLPSFGQLVSHRRFVGPAAMHAAIPGASMPRVVDMILLRRRADPALTGARLLAWLLASETRLQVLDKAVERFLIHGGEFAIDVLDRIIEVVAHVGEQPQSLEDESITTDTTGLPRVMLAALLGSLWDRIDDVQAQPRAANKTVGHDECAVRLDVGAGAIALHLPTVSTKRGPVIWSVSADGETEEVRSRAQWVGEDATAAATAAFLRRPARTVHVRLRGQDYVELALVDPADPLLVFDLDGELLSPALPLPRGELWVVLPETHRLEDGAGNPVRVVGALGSPIGWSGWDLRQIDVQGSAAVRAVGDGHSGRPRMVRSSGAPVFNTPAPNGVLQTLRGSDVVTQRPVVLLPAGADPAVWQVEVVHNSAGQRIARSYSLASCDVLDDGRDPLSPFPAPLLGDYFVSVRGAFGKKAQRLISIAEGLRVEADPSLRLPVRGGVQASTVTLSCDPPMVLSRDALTLGVDELQAEVICRVGDQVERLVLSPPRVQMRLSSADLPSGWVSTAPVVAPEHLERPTALHVLVPGDGGPPRLEFTASSGDERQSVEAGGRGGSGSRVFDLTKFADTARRSRAGRFDVVTPSGAITVALLRPQGFASGAVARLGGIQLENYRHFDDVVAAVYLETAPWLPPREVSVSEVGFLALPPELMAAGPLSIELAVVDPWVPQNWPEWPGEHAVRCSLPGYGGAGCDATEPLARLLAGEPPTEAEVLLELPAVWAVFHLIDRLSLKPEIFRPVHQALLDAVHRDADAALISLSRSTKESSSVVQLLLRSHLVERRFSGVTPAELAGMWASAPVAAALAAVPSFVGDPDGAESADMARSLRLHGGPGLMEILDTGHDAHREVGAFGPTARLMDGMSAGQVDAIWTAAQVVPNGLLHPDSRSAAAKQLFDARRSPKLALTFQLIRQELGRTRRTLIEIAPPAVVKQLDARLDNAASPTWGLLPAVSFAWAAAARLRAQDSSSVPRMSPGRRQAWCQMAKLAPDYVGMDIVLADALLQSANRPIHEKVSQ